MARRADRKLNPDAVKAANAAVGNRTLHPTDPSDADARKRWMDAYETANGRPLEDSSSSNSLVDSPSQTCDPTWCEIRYKYADGTGVPDAEYLVLAIDSVSGMQKEYKGKVDSSGFARVEGLPAGCSVVSCSFDNDPKDWEPFPSESPKPHGLKNLQLNWPKKQESLPGMEIAPTDGAFFFSQLPTTKAIIAPYIDAFAEWMKPIILGDWDEADPSYGQIAVRTAIEMIPVVDQIADVRDLAAAVNKLVIDERYDEFWVWFDFVTTLVGCIPEVGSALKGLLRAFGKAGGKWVGPTTEAIFRWMNKKGKGNAVKKITQWANELESKIKGEVLKLGTQILENSKKLLEQLKNWAMGVYDPLATWAAKKVENFVEVVKNFPKRVNEILSSVRKGLNDWKAERKGKRETAVGQTDKHNTDGKNNTAPTAQQQKGDIGEGPRGIETVQGSGTKAFERSLAEDPKRLFNRGAMEPNARARLDKFPSPDCGASVTKLKPMAGRPISDIKSDLRENGFKEIPPAAPNTRRPPDMEIFVHEDGGLVKIKPNGDGAQFTDYGREGPMVSKEVLTDPSKTGEELTKFDNVAFKVNDANQPIAKSPSQLNRPPEAMQGKLAKDEFDKAWADSGHTKPATPPGFVQRTSNN